MLRARSCLCLNWLALLWLALLTLPAAAQRIDDTITAHYPFEGNLDEAAGIDTRPTVTGTLEYTTGALGRSVRLTNDDEIDFGGIPSSTFSGNFTVAWFMNLDSSGSHPLFGKESACDSGQRFITSVGSGSPARLNFLLSNGIDSATAIGSVPRKQWVHVAVVRDGNQALVYVDGIAGRPASLPTLSLGSITAPFGLANSPCIGRTLGLFRPEGRFDELRIYPRALNAETVAGLARRLSFAATPSRATPGAKIVVRASHLVVDRTYELRLTGSTTVPLFRGPATGASMSWTVDVPEVAGGRYQLELAAVLLRSLVNVERSAPFTVAPRLSITSSASPQAGKKASFTVNNLTRGNLTRLYYGGRLLAGPEAATGSSHTFNVVLPRDFPASLPANVALRAEQLDGRSVALLGDGSVNIAAPFTGRFAAVQQIASDRTLVPPDEKVKVTGRLSFADGADAGNTEVSAYWVGDDGSVTPLPTSELELAADGALRLDTRPPSLSSMTAVRPQVGGRIRLAKKRTNEFGRVEWEFEEGPRLETVNDTDPDTDITVRVLRRGTQGTVPLEGAYIVLSSAAPLGYTFDPPGAADGGSNADIGGGALYQHRQPNLRDGSETSKALAARPGAVNQLNNTLADLPPPPAPACGESLYRRYTDASGRAEFPVLGGPEEEPAGWQSVQSTQFSATACTGLGCEEVQVIRNYEFQLTVYTLHTGAGYRNENTRAEQPVRFEISYNRDTETFTIKNLRTGETSIQQVSANLVVEVPTITSTDTFITFDDPLMYHEIGGQPINLVSKYQGGFGRWIDFGEDPEAGPTRVSEFVNPSPDKVIQFGHRPDANGSISSAQLYLPNLITGQPSLIGEFEQVSIVDGCNLQEDPSNNRTETWRLKLRPEFANSWRFPRGVFFPQSGPRRACGHIAAQNARGGTGRLNLCFHWQKAPDFMFGNGGPIKVNDADMFDVQIEEEGYQLGGAATTVPKRQADLLGEPLDKPGRIDNSTNARNGTYSSVGPNGQTGGTRRLAGNNPKQFNEGASGAQSLLNLQSAADSVSIGSDEYETVLDATIPLFQWYWGIPEILSAEVFAQLRLIAKYYFGGTISKVNGRERLDLLTNAVFFTLITIGVDIDVLFGFIVDAGASLTGSIISEMPVVVRDGVNQQEDPCITFKLDFNYYVDPCPICPTPAIEDTEEVLSERVPAGCGFYSASKLGISPAADPEIAALSQANPKDFALGFEMARQLKRQPALAYDRLGNGQMLMLNEARQLTASRVTDAGFSEVTTLTVAMGARNPQVAYYAEDRGIAVWAENALPESEFRVVNYVTLARAQRLAYAEWDGESWGEKRILTEPGAGEGQLTLVACPDGETGCPAGGEVLAVWQRDANSNAQDPQYRLWYAQFRPETGFSAPASIDPSPTPGVQDITPAAAYVGGRPVVVWSRQFGSLNDLSQRNLAYRVLPGGVPIALGAAPGASAPSVAAAGGSSLRVGWLKADPNTSSNPNAGSANAVGTQHALHVTQATCNATTCSFPTALVPPTRDELGRRIYGERPRLIRGENDVIIVMRVFRFEGEANEQVQPGDPVGTVINSADVVTIAPNYSTGIARVTPLTADGFTHLGVFGAYNPATRSIVSGSSVFAPPFPAPFRNALKATGFKGHVAYAKQIGSSGPVEVRSIIDAPDLAVEQVNALDALAPSTPQRTQVLIGNRGSGYSPTRDGLVQVELRWNSPGGPLLTSGGLGAIGSGGERTVELTWTAPANAHADEGGVLYALIVPAPGFDEVTDDNNLGQLDYPGLPVPVHLASSAIPGIPQVQLGWDPIDDPRIDGYRVYRKEADGSWTPMGASPAHGFLDLSASFLVPRTYAVSTYSARGVESPLSKAITVMPVPAAESLLPFVDGFETGN